MPYLIDGHNLIGVGLLDGISLADADDEAKLVQRLAGFAARSGRRCTVIFDAGLPGGRSRMSTRAVQVVFASQRSSADNVLCERMKKFPDPRQWILVSSDARVRRFALERNIRALASEEFARLLERPEALPRDAGEDPNPQIPPEDVDAWLGVFGADS